MNRWEYREVVWQPDQVVVTDPSRDGRPGVETYDASEWYGLLAQFGDDGWEMINCTGSPMGVHEYYFYFKRPVLD